MAGPRRLQPPAGVLIAISLLLTCGASPAAAQQEGGGGCELATLFTHLTEIQEGCCGDGGCRVTGYPDEDDDCERPCAEIFEPFWDTCGEMLHRMRVDGTHGMTVFYDTCLSVLYPPGQCADECTPSMMHCRMMEVQIACCSDARNCPDDSTVPRRCPVQCALVFPTLVDSCADAMEEGGLDVDAFRRFSDECMRQDSTELVEYAVGLVEQGCIVNFDDEGEDRGRRLGDGHGATDMERRFASTARANGANGDKTAMRVMQVRKRDRIVSASRQLQQDENPACKDFVDDPNGELAATGVDCQQVLLLGCDTDLHLSAPAMPEGSLVSLVCPVSCNECHRSGMAKWIETATACPWDKLAGRLDEANAVCCSEQADEACPSGAPPRQCPPLCAVTFHVLMSDCADTLLGLTGDANSERFAAFDELCTSERSVDTGSFLHAVATATCCSTSNCAGCSDEASCEAQSDDASSCLWNDDVGCANEATHVASCAESGMAFDPNARACVHWVLLVRQTAGTYHDRDEWRRGVNSENPDSPDYSILDSLDDEMRVDGKFQFKLVWPQNGLQTTNNFNEWRQTSNPLEISGDAVEGYEEVEIHHRVNNWGGGMSVSSQGATYLDCTPHSDNWCYAIASREEWSGGIPACCDGSCGQNAARVVELWVYV